MGAWAVMLGVGSCWDMSDEERVALWPRGSGPGQWPPSTWDGSRASSLQGWPREGGVCPLPQSGRGPRYPFIQGVQQPGDHALTPAAHHHTCTGDVPGATWLTQEAYHAGAGDADDSSDVFHLGLDGEENLHLEGGSVYGSEVVYDPLGVTTHLAHAGRAPNTTYPTYENVYVQAGDYLLSRSDAAQVAAAATHQARWGCHTDANPTSTFDDDYTLQDAGEIYQERPFWLHQEARPLHGLQGRVEKALIFEKYQKDGGSVQAAVDASLAGLDNPALEHTEETQAQVDRLALALGDNIRSQIDNTLSRIDNTRAKLNQQRRPFSDGILPATDVAWSGPVVTAASGDQERLSSIHGQLYISRPPLLTESAGARMTPVLVEEPLVGHEGAAPVAVSPDVPSDRGNTPVPEDGAPLARQETMVESVREYDDISVTTLVTLDTSTPTPAPMRSNKSMKSLRSQPSVKSQKSQQSQKSRRSWVSVAWRGSSLSSTVISLEPLHLDQLFKRSGTSSP